MFVMGGGLRVLGSRGDAKIDLGHQLSTKKTCLSVNKC